MLLSSFQIEKLSDLIGEIGHIFFATVFIGPFFNEKTNWFIVIIGLILSMVCWGGSLFLIKIKQYERIL